MTVGWTHLGRGLVAGMLERQVRERGSFVRWIGVGIMVVGLIAAVGWGGFVRGLGITLVLVGLIVVLLVMLVRTMALAAINKFATPTSLAEKREVIDRAMGRADLPTGPISIVRFLVRLRKGVGPEVARLDAVLDDLRADLALSDDELAQAELAQAALDRGALDQGVLDQGALDQGADGSITPELPE